MANSLNDGLSKPDQLAQLGLASDGSIQAGEDVATAGSIFTIDFPTNFSSAPTVVISVVGGLSEHPTISVSGAQVDVETAAASGSWIAIGPGGL